MLSLTTAVYFDRDMEETIPVCTYIFMILLYLAGISGIIAHAAEFLLLYLFAGTFFFLLLSIIKYKKSVISGAGKKIGSAGVWVFLGFCIVSVLLSHHLRVTNWDDLNYWALFPKDMYMINGVPTGGMNSSMFRDYYPVIQYLYFCVFKVFGKYRESYMFAVNFILLLISMLPYFKRYEKESLTRYICKVTLGALMPAVCSYQMFHCLGVDIIMTFLFGQAVIFTYDKKRDFFYYIRFLSVTLVLTMSKTSGILFALTAVAVFAVENFRFKIKSILPAAFIGICNILFHYSWKVFCRIRGNTSYLSDNLNTGMADGSGLIFPDYTGSTIKAFIRAFAVKNLNGSPFGLSALGMAVIGAVVFIICIRICADRKRRLLEGGVLAVGMAAYLSGMVYAYLFVFEKWEADSLSSFDRYITVFFGAILYAAVFFGFTVIKKKEALKTAVTILLLATVNFSFALRTMVPSEFERAYAGAYGMVDEFDAEFEKLSIPEMPFGNKILFVDCTDDMQRTKTIPYCAVPCVSRVISFVDRDHMDADDILEEAKGNDVRYVVFLGTDGSDNMIGNETELLEDSGHIEQDVLYKYDSEKNVITR